MGEPEAVVADLGEVEAVGTIRLHLRFFASIADELQARTRVVDVAARATPRDVFRLLVREHPALDRLTDHVSFARNEEFVPGDETLADGDELVFIPPVSGGA